MKYFILITFSLTVLLASCTTVYKKPSYMVDSSIYPHIKVFNKYYTKYKKKKIPYNVRIYIANIKSSSQASGVYFVQDNYTILSKKHWEKFNYYEREMLFFHEMGHHILKRAHYWDLPRKFEDGCPKSIMFWKTFNLTCYLKRRNTYIKELFEDVDRYDRQNQIYNRN